VSKVSARFYVKRGDPAAHVNICMVRIIIFVTQVIRVQHRVKTKLHDKQALR